MFLELEELIFEGLSKVSLKINSDEPEQLSKFIEIPSLPRTCLQIAPYAELTIGTTLPIVASKILRKQGIDITPDVVAKSLWQNLMDLSSDRWEIFVGEEAFVNFRPKANVANSFFDSMLKVDPKTYFANLIKSLSSVKKYSFRECLEQKFETELKCREISRYVIYENEKSFGIELEEVLLKLYLLSDIEADFSFCQLGKPVSDNIIWSFSEFEKVVDLASNPKGVNVFIQSKSGYSPTLDSNFNMTSEIVAAVKRFLLIGPFSFIDSVKQMSPELFFKEFRAILNLTLNSLNNPWIKDRFLGIGSSQYDQDFIFLRKSLKWILDFEKLVLLLFLEGALGDEFSGSNVLVD